MTALLSARLMLWVAGPSPSPSSLSPQQIQGPVNDNGGVGAGTLAFLVIAGLLIVSGLLFVAMNRSLRRARHNLGGDQLPRRPNPRRPVIPIRDDDPPRNP